MNITNKIINSLNISTINDYKLTFYLPTSSGNVKEEVLSFARKDKQKNIIIISAQTQCCIVPTGEFNTAFINFSLKDPVFDVLLEHVQISKYQIINSLVQSYGNFGIVIFLEDDIFYVDVIKMVKFVRESLKSKIPIKIYILSSIINDIFYTKLMLLNCDCVAPFIDSTYYGTHSPQSHQEISLLQDEIIKTLPPVTNSTETQEMDLPTFWEYNYNSYFIQDIYGHLSSEGYRRPKSNHDINNINIPENTDNYKKVLFDIEIFPDIEMHFTLIVLWKHFARIIHYINSVAHEHDLSVVYKNVLRKIDEELTKSKNYSAYYQSISEYLPIIFSSPQNENCYPVKVEHICQDLYQNAFCYYHLFARMIAIIVYTLNYVLDRDKKEKIAMKIMYILKKDIGIFPIPIYLEEKWQELNILDIFKHFRKNSL